MSLPYIPILFEQALRAAILFMCFASGNAFHPHLPGRASQTHVLACAQGALRAAVALCKRHSRDAAPEAAQALWFGLLQCYVGALRQLRQAQRCAAEQPQVCG